MRALEEELGVVLFERTPLGMRPTAAGEALLGRARAILGEVESAAAEARAIGGRAGP